MRTFRATGRKAAYNFAVFSVRLVARPDARMVEVPLEIEAELPREFEGAALLAASGLPRKVKIKAQKDALKLSTAYRTDQLVADIVKSALRGTAIDVQRVQEAVTKFIRTVRERRQDGAALVISSNGRGKIDVFEQMPAARAGAPAVALGDLPRMPVPADRLIALERRLVELETAFARLAAGGDPAGRVAQLEERVATLQARGLAGGELSGPEQGRPGARVIPRAAASTHTTTAVEAYAEGLRHEILASASAAFGRARTDTDRCDKAAALAAEAELLGAPVDGTALRLRDASAQAAARQSALERLAQEVEFYQHAELPVAAQLLQRLEDSSGDPDPAPSLEPVAQAVVRAATGGDSKARTAWLKRAAALCGWQLVTPERGDSVDPEWHQAVDSGGDTVVRLASPGAKRVDGSGLVRARVQVDPAVRSLPEEPDEPAAVPEPLNPPASIPPPPPSSQRPLLAPVSDPPAPAATQPETKSEPDRKPEPEPDRASTSPADSTLAAPPPASTLAPAAVIHDTPADSAKVPQQAPGFVAPFGDLAGEGEIRPDEAAAAARAASRIPKIVSEDPSRSDEALATEVALAVETETSEDTSWARVARGPDAFAARPEGPDEVEAEVMVTSEEDIVEVHELSEPLPDDPGPKGK